MTIVNPCITTYKHAFNDCFNRTKIQNRFKRSSHVISSRQTVYLIWIMIARQQTTSHHDYHLLMHCRPNFILLILFSWTASNVECITTGVTSYHTNGKPSPPKLPPPGIGKWKAVYWSASIYNAISIPAYSIHVLAIVTYSAVGVCFCSKLRCIISAYVYPLWWFSVGHTRLTFSYRSGF